MPSIELYLILSSLLFSLGVYAVLSRRYAVAILMGIELILNSCNLNFIAFNYFNGSAMLEGQVISIFVIVLAAAEAAVALAIVINLFKMIGTVNIDKANQLKG